MKRATTRPAYPSLRAGCFSRSFPGAGWVGRSGPGAGVRSGSRSGVGAGERSGRSIGSTMIVRDGPGKVMALDRSLERPAS